MVNYQEIVNLFELAVEENEFYKGFGHGSIDNLDSVVNRGYPLLFMRPLASQGLSGFDGRVRTLTFELYSLDVPKLSDNDKRISLSNTEQGIYDVYSYILDGPVQKELQIEMTGIVPTIEAFGDKAAGWVGTINVIGDSIGITYCNIPGNAWPTATPTPFPTASPTATPTPTVSPTPTSTPTSTPIQPTPTATPVPTTTPTSTPVGPTPTATPIVPTATPTSTPTSTPIQPTPTATPVPTATPTSTPIVPTSTPTPTATDVPPTPTAVPNPNVVYTVIETSFNSDTTASWIDEFNNEVTQSYAPPRQLFMIGALTGSVQLNDGSTGSQVFYSDVEYGQTFATESVTGYEYVVRQNGLADPGSDDVVFYSKVDDVNMYFKYMRSDGTCKDYHVLTGDTGSFYVDDTASGISFYYSGSRDIDTWFDPQYFPYIINC